jgi:hypothetical protein
MPPRSRRVSRVKGSGTVRARGESLRLHRRVASHSSRHPSRALEHATKASGQPRFELGAATKRLRRKTHSLEVAQTSLWQPTVSLRPPRLSSSLSTSTSGACDFNAKTTDSRVEARKANVEASDARLAPSHAVVGRVRAFVGMLRAFVGTPHTNLGASSERVERPSEEAGATHSRPGATDVLSARSRPRGEHTDDEDRRTGAVEVSKQFIEGGHIRAHARRVTRPRLRPSWVGADSERGLRPPALRGLPGVAGGESHNADRCGASRAAGPWYVRLVGGLCINA